MSETYTISLGAHAVGEGLDYVTVMSRRRELIGSGTERSKIKVVRDSDGTEVVWGRKPTGGRDPVRQLRMSDAARSETEEGARLMGGVSWSEFMREAALEKTRELKAEHGFDPFKPLPEGAEVP